MLRENGFEMLDFREPRAEGRAEITSTTPCRPPNGHGSGRQRRYGELA